MTEPAAHPEVRVRWRPGDPRADLLLDRPAKRNALTVGMLDAIADAADRLGALDGPRVVVVRSTSSDTFSAGADIREWGAFSPLEAMQASVSGTRAMAALASLPCPVIAALGGACLGGGLELALACDLRVAGRGARLGFPEATLGNATGWGGLPRLVSLVGPGRAKDLLLTGRIIDAEEAAGLGLVTTLVAGEALEERVDELAERVIANAPLALRAIKRMVDGLAAPPDHAFHVEALAAALHAGSEDARRAKAAFLNKTAVDFRGR